MSVSLLKIFLFILTIVGFLGFCLSFYQTISACVKDIRTRQGKLLIILHFSINGCFFMNFLLLAVRAISINNTSSTLNSIKNVIGLSFDICFDLSFYLLAYRFLNFAIELNAYKILFKLLIFICQMLVIANVMLDLCFNSALLIFGEKEGKDIMKFLAELNIIIIMFNVLFISSALLVTSYAWSVQVRLCLCSNQKLFFYLMLSFGILQLFGLLAEGTDLEKYKDSIYPIRDIIMIFAIFIMYFNLKEAFSTLQPRRSSLMSN